MKALLRRFRSWLTQPRRSRAYRRVKQGHQHALKDDWFEALVEYKEAVREDPTYAPALVNRGLAWLNAGDFEMAELDLLKAITLEPANAFSHYARGIVLRHRGKYLEAIDDLDESFRLDPAPTQYSPSDLFGERGTCWSHLLEHQKAIDDFTAALGHKPETAIRYEFRGWNRHLLGDYRGAEIDYCEAIRIGPDFKHLYVLRAANRELLGDKQGALQDLELVKDFLPEPDRLCLIAHLLSDAKQYRSAIEMYEAVLLQDPQSFAALNSLAWILATCPDELLRDGRRAMALSKKACAQSDFKVGLLVGTLAAAHAEAGLFEDAVRLQTSADSMYSPAERQQWGFLKQLYEARQPYPHSPLPAIQCAPVDSARRADDGRGDIGTDTGQSTDEAPPLVLRDVTEAAASLSRIEP